MIKFFHRVLQAGPVPPGFPSGPGAAFGPFCGPSGDCATDPDAKLRHSMRCLSEVTGAGAGRKRRQLNNDRRGMIATIIHEDLP